MPEYIKPQSKQPMWTQTTGPVGDYGDFIGDENNDLPASLVTVHFLQTNSVPQTGGDGGVGQRIVTGFIVAETANTIRVQEYKRNMSREKIKDYSYSKCYFGPYSHKTITIPKHLIEAVVEDDLDVLLTPEDMDYSDK